MVCVLGAGYVGLVTGTCLADSGADVAFLDVDASRVRTLQQGSLPIFEPGLLEFFQRNLRAGRLTATTSPEQALSEARWAFVAVGTPPREDGSTDLSHVESAVRTVGEHAPEGLVLAVKSTVPVGTADRAREILSELGREDIPVVSNPEFLREGQAVQDFTRPDRIVVGCRERDAGEGIIALHKPYLGSNTLVFLMDNRSAEMTKYTANAFLATRISFINEIANLCEHLGADVEHVRLAAGADRRIGAHFFHPGVGYGGSCFPKDVRSVISMGSSHGYETRLITAVHEVNEAQKRRLTGKIRAHLGPCLRDKRIGVWGLAFKRDTDDTRESPAVVLVSDLLAEGCTVQIFDPAAMGAVHDYWEEGVIGCAGMYDALVGVDALAVVTDWQEFRLPNWAKARKLMKGNTVFDGRNLYEPAVLRRAGLVHIAMGRPEAAQPPEAAAGPEGAAH